MKKFITLCAASAIALSLCACKSQPAATPTVLEPSETTSAETEVIEAKTYTLDDIKAVFNNDKAFEGCEITDCVIAEDRAYGLIGVIQYTAKDGNPAWLAFVKEDSSSAVGLDADGGSIIAKDSVLTYIGNGVVALSLENTKTGEISDCTMAYSYDEETNHTNFEANANIRK